MTTSQKVKMASLSSRLVVKPIKVKKDWETKSLTAQKLIRKQRKDKGQREQTRDRKTQSNLALSVVKKFVKLRERN